MDSDVEVTLNSIQGSIGYSVNVYNSDNTTFTPLECIDPGVMNCKFHTSAAQVQKVLVIVTGSAT